VTAFTRAAEALQAADQDADLCGPFSAALPVTGVCVTTLGDPFGSETVCASDAAAARLDEIQIDLGEGPCWEAMRRDRPVLEPDLQRSRTTAWPLAMHGLRETGIGGVFAFPMRVGGIDVGAVDLYTAEPNVLSPHAVRDAAALSAIVARTVLHRALVLADSADPEHPVSGPYGRWEVHQATGMIAAMSHIGVDDALLVLRGHAWASGRPVLDVAVDVIAGALDFTVLNDQES
jgi:hypothetical protein